MDRPLDYRNEITFEEAEGKTISEVRDGYETLTVLFEDGSFVEKYTYSGNPRDL